jgi:hypothetical protein
MDLASSKSIEATSCGDCTACCTIFAIAELNKPQHVTCKHLCGTRCEIYEARPRECAEYFCGWRQGLVTGVDRRPDKWGVVFHRPADTAVPSLHVYELVAGRSQDKGVQWAIAKFRKRFPNFRIVYIAPGTIVENAEVAVVGADFYLKNAPQR